MMPTMRAVQVSKPNGPLELVERDIPVPGPRQVRIIRDRGGKARFRVVITTGTQ